MNKILYLAVLKKKKACILKGGFEFLYKAMVLKIQNSKRKVIFFDEKGMDESA